MKRRRRKNLPQDSLELLLDTICNTFGGIVFIALLVVLMLRNTAPALVKPQDVVSPDELVRLASQLEAVTAELSSLRTARAELARRAQAFAPHEVRDLMAERDALAEEMDAIHGARDWKVAENASLAAEIERQESELGAIPERLAEAKAEVDRLQAELNATRRSKAREIRNPLVRQSGSWRELGLVLRYGRMYLWHRYDADGERAGLNTEEFVVVGEEDGTIITHPDPTKGIPLTKGGSTDEAIRNRLRPFPSGRFYVAVVVRPDSFDRFAILRDVLIRAGYDYRLMPSESSVTDTGGSDTRVQ